MSNDLSAQLQAHLNKQAAEDDEGARESTFKEVAALIARITGADIDDIERATTLEDLEVTSLNLVEFTVRAEDMFGIRLSESDATAITTVEDAVDLIDQLRQDSTEQPDNS